MRPLSPVDQMFVRMESERTPMHIGAFAIFQLPEGAGPGFVHDIHRIFSRSPRRVASSSWGGSSSDCTPTRWT